LRGEANSFNVRSMNVFKGFIVKAFSEFESHGQTCFREQLKRQAIIACHIFFLPIAARFNSRDSIVTSAHALMRFSASESEIVFIRAPYICRCFFSILPFAGMNGNRARKGTGWLKIAEEKSSFKLHGAIIFKVAPGMAVEFRDVSSEDAELLKAYILELLNRDILEEQGEPVITKNHRTIYS